MKTSDLRRCAVAVYVATEEGPAKDIAAHLNWAADEIEHTRAVLLALYNAGFASNDIRNDSQAMREAREILDACYPSLNVHSGEHMSRYRRSEDKYNRAAEGGGLRAGAEHWLGFDAMCQCGHKEGMHYSNGNCTALGCVCNKFRATNQQSTGKT